MTTPCEKLVRGSLPVFRALVARALIEKYKLTQVEVAERLGITQAAVSQYLYSKRGESKREGMKGLETIRDAADKMAKDVYEGKISKEALVPTICNICHLIKMKDMR